MTKWTEAKATALSHPLRGDRCECCGDRKHKSFLHAHHVFYHRMKGKPELDCEENMQLVCSVCHLYGDANSWPNQKLQWDYLCRVYGAAHMHDWHEALPLKAKENFG